MKRKTEATMNEAKNHHSEWVGKLCGFLSADPQLTVVVIGSLVGVAMCLALCR